jgi:hypothetical protein
VQNEQKSKSHMVAGPSIIWFGIDNAPGSQIYTDAQMLHKIVKSIHTSQTTEVADTKELASTSASEIPPAPVVAVPVPVPVPVTPTVTTTVPKIEPQGNDDNDDEDDEDDEDGADDPSNPNKRRRLSSSAPPSDGQGQTPGSGRRGPRGPYRKHGPSIYKTTKTGMLALDKMRNPE